MGIKIIKAGKPGLWNHEVPPGVSHHPFDFAFVIPLARAAKSILKQIMRHQFREYTGSFACPITQNAGNSNPGVVVQDRHRYATEKRERRDMCITERLGCLGRVRLQKTRLRMRQIHHQKVDLAFLATDNGKRLTKVRPGLAGRMRQWNKHLLLTLLGSEGVVPHDLYPTRKLMLIAQTLEDAL